MQEGEIKKCLNGLRDVGVIIIVVFVLSIPFYFAWNNINILFRLGKIEYFNAVSILTLIFIFIRVIKIAIGKKEIENEQN